MATAEADAAAGVRAARIARADRRGGRRKLAILLVLLPLLGAGFWFGGLLTPLLDLGTEAGQAVAARPAGPQPQQAPMVDLPEIIANLNAPGRRTSFVRLRAKLEVSRAEDMPLVQAAMPRLLDLFATYLREVRPEELRGSAGSYRLREELTARANLAVAPARITDVLFQEILVQ